MFERYKKLDDLFLKIVYNDKLYDANFAAWKNQIEMIKSLKIRIIARVGIEKEDI